MVRKPIDNDNDDNNINIDMSSHANVNKGINIGGGGNTTGVDLNNVSVGDGHKPDDNYTWFAMMMIFVLLIIALAWGRNQFSVRGLGVEGSNTPATPQIAESPEKPSSP